MVTTLQCTPLQCTLIKLGLASAVASHRHEQQLKRTWTSASISAAMTSAFSQATCSRQQQQQQQQQKHS
jgi:hypothetical protein